MCTRVLADFGARVIKVENPNGGDFARDYDDVVNGPGGLAAHFVWCNRGKESVTLNLKSPAGMDVLHRLLDRADALVSNLAPGSTARMGLAPADLRRAAPRRDPRRDRRLRTRRPDLAQARLRPAGAGRRRIVRRHRLSRACPPNPDPPWPTSPPGCTPRCRSWRCCSRGRPSAEGPAPAVGLSLFDVMTDIMGYQLTYTQHSGIDQQPLGVGSPAVAPYGAFPTRDGQTVVLGTTNDREWQRVAREIIDRPDLADDPRFATNPDRCAHRDDPRTRPSDPGARSMISRHPEDRRRRRDRQLALQPAQRGGRSPAAGRPRPLARGGYDEGPDPGAAAAAGDRPDTIRRWVRCPVWASTRTPCLPNSAWAGRHRGVARAGGHRPGLSP